LKSHLHIDKRRIIGYAAGILAGVSYGTNPLFGKALMESGVPVMVMLFFRYGMAVGIAICVAAVVFMILKPGKKVR
jgi:drug/metabolite transporter (DMT)-like permease